MKHFLLNLLLAVVWMFLWGHLSIPLFLWGFVIGFLILSLTHTSKDTHLYFRKSILWVKFIFFFVWEFFLSALKVAFDVITYKRRMCPGVLAVPLDAKTDSEILFFANVISLTPGTLSLDVSEDRKFLYVHFMYLQPERLESFRYEIKDKFERKILELVR